MHQGFHPRREARTDYSLSPVAFCLLTYGRRVVAATICSVKQRCVYKGFQITILVTQTPGDRFDAQIAIVAMAGARMRWQRFLDLNNLGSEVEAEQLAMAAARDWIDDHAQRERSDLGGFVLQSQPPSAHPALTR